MFRSSQTADLPPSRAVDYAPAPPRAHRALRRATWWVFVVAITTFTAIAGWRVANQLHYLWLQHELMSYDLPDGPMRVGVDGFIQNAPAWPYASCLESFLTPYYPIFIHERSTSTATRRLILVQDCVTPRGPRLYANALVPASIVPGSK